MPLPYTDTVDLRRQRHDGFRLALVALFVLLVAAAMVGLAWRLELRALLYHWASLLGNKRWDGYTDWIHLSNTSASWPESTIGGD